MRIKAKRADLSPQGFNGGIFNREYGDGVKSKADENDCMTLLVLADLPKGCTSIDLYFEYKNGRYKELTIPPDELTKDMVGDIFLKHGRTGRFNDLEGNIIIIPNNSPDMRIELFLEEKEDTRGLGMAGTIGYLSDDSPFQEIFGNIVPLRCPIASHVLDSNGEEQEFYFVDHHGITWDQIDQIIENYKKTGVKVSKKDFKTGLQILTKEFASVSFPNPYTDFMRIKR